jgi:glycosyltransferase involved in cell wall biosynthesis
MPPRFTIGWVGRPTIYQGAELQRPQWLVDSVRLLNLPPKNYQITLLGERLEPYYRQLVRARLPARYILRQQRKSSALHYQGFDCVVITGARDVAPFSLYEALATGLPVISTPLPGAAELIRSGENGYLITSVEELTEALGKICADRMGWFERRHAIRETVEALTLDSWVEANLQLAAKLAHSSAGKPAVLDRSQPIPAHALEGVSS